MRTTGWATVLVVAALLSRSPHAVSPRSTTEIAATHPAEVRIPVLSFRTDCRC